MPKTILSKMLSERKEQFEDLGTLINVVVFLGKKDAEEVGRMMGFKRASAYKYLKNPELLPLNRLLRLCKALDIPADKVKECIRY